MTAYFNVPGVTFVASTGDYGAADPEYPAFSPNVVAVGGTSLTLNADNSYNSETGWGYYSDSAGAFIGSGGGISLYEPEPAYQQGVQSTGYRTTPDVSLVADPATGAWIADPYNLDPSNPFEIVGGTSLSAPAWAGLVALVNQGRAAAGESTLNSSSPTDTQQALYMLPQTDYNVDHQRQQWLQCRRRLQPGDGAGDSGGQSAGARPDRVPGARHDLLRPDRRGLAECHPGEYGDEFQHPIDVFSVFDSLTVTQKAFRHAADAGHRGEPSPAMSVTLPVVGMMPLNAVMTAHDSALTDWTSSRAAGQTTDTSGGGMESGQAVSRTPVLQLQAALVDAALEDFGVLLSGDGTNPPSNKPKVKLRVPAVGS